VPLRGSRCATYLGMGDADSSAGSCFDSVYVKWLEAAGARVMPILYDWPPEKLEHAFKSVNAILFTGGGEPLTNMSSQFMQTSMKLFNLTIEANKKQDYFPLWGTCMGFQTLNILAAGDPSVLTLNSFDSEDLSLNLERSPGWDESRMISGLRSEVREWLLGENITTNFHHDGVEPKAYTTSERLSHFFRVISENTDRKGTRFVSTIEAFDFPIYGVQWHPERNQFEFWDKNDPISHTPHAIKAMQALADFLVSEARENCHDPSAAKMIPLINNYYPRPLSSPFQSYLFPPASTTGN